jgi:hypothetical protein
VQESTLSLIPSEPTFDSHRIVGIIEALAGEKTIGKQEHQHREKPLVSCRHCVSSWSRKLGLSRLKVNPGGALITFSEEFLTFAYANNVRLYNLAAILRAYRIFKKASVWKVFPARNAGPLLRLSFSL